MECKLRIGFKKTVTPPTQKKLRGKEAARYIPHKNKTKDQK